MYKRTLNLPELLGKKSHFLLGPRATGKSTLIQNSLPGCLVFDLLHDATFQSLLKRPSLLSESIVNPGGIIVIDEIQRIPNLLNEVHRLIFQKKGTFLLTGSSARKLKHGSSNLLGGRAWMAHLFPLTSFEITDFDLLKYLNRGGLPDVYLSPYPTRELESYVSLYLQQEIKAEALTRNVQAFAEFLDVVALSNGQEINYERLASDCQVSVSTLKNYFQILEDTLVGFRISGYQKTKKRKPTIRAKHYLFDLGVTNSLCKRQILSLDGDAVGPAFEHFIATELRAYLSYFNDNRELCYWRSTSQYEVDFVIGDDIAVEVKSTKLGQEKHLTGLRALKEENLLSRYILVSMDERFRRTKDGIEIYPYADFLKDLWQGTFAKNS